VLAYVLGMTAQVGALIHLFNRGQRRHRQDHRRGGGAVRGLRQRHVPPHRRRRGDPAAARAVDGGGYPVAYFVAACLSVGAMVVMVVAGPVTSYRASFAG
jgi:hypothetical protein